MEILINIICAAGRLHVAVIQHPIQYFFLLPAIVAEVALVADFILHREV